MPSKKSQLSSKLILIPYSFGSFKQKMVFMLRNNPHIQSQTSHVAILQNQADPKCSPGLCMPRLTQTQAPETSLDQETGKQDDLTLQFALALF